MWAHRTAAQAEAGVEVRSLIKHAILAAYCHGLIPLRLTGWLVRKLGLSAD